MTNKTKHHGKKLFFRYCLYWFSGSRVLEGHVKNSLAINHTKSVSLPNKNEYVNFQNSKRSPKAPFI